MEPKRQQLAKAILKIQTKQDQFDELALEVFQYQATHNPIYAHYCALLNIKPKSIANVAQIPFLPIQFFKKYPIKTDNWEEEAIFRSSGTTGSVTSQHFVRAVDFYHQVSKIGFEAHYQNLESYCILALLPSYLERSDSSLVSMAQYFMSQSDYKKESGFFLQNFKDLKNAIHHCQQQKINIILLGVSFALLDFADKYPIPLGNVVVMETGGMKGRRKEMIRTELHDILKKAFSVENIHSEYGMTELLSQAYAPKSGRFFTSPTMKVLMREINDPFCYSKKSGALNIIDLANLDSCSFIATDDLGKFHKDGSFEVLGRMDGSDIRGCNLMVSDVIS